MTTRFNHRQWFLSIDVRVALSYLLVSTSSPFVIPPPVSSLCPFPPLLWEMVTVSPTAVGSNSSSVLSFCGSSTGFYVHCLCVLVYFWFILFCLLRRNCVEVACFHLPNALRRSIALCPKPVTIYLFSPSSLPNPTLRNYALRPVVSLSPVSFCSFCSVFVSGSVVDKPVSPTTTRRPAKLTILPLPRPKHFHTDIDRGA
jgi:hypothetical protein